MLRQYSEGAIDVLTGVIAMNCESDAASAVHDVNVFAFQGGMKLGAARVHEGEDAGGAAVMQRTHGSEAKV